MIKYLYLKNREDLFFVLLLFIIFFTLVAFHVNEILAGGISSVISAAGMVMIKYLLLKAN